MPLGWIDFSKNERNKVLSVLDQLTEAGTLDELGIAPIRDGYADLFFPGTSTIQTRAKYFFIVPYALRDMEYSNETNPNRMARTFDEIERKCGQQLLEIGSDIEGIVGNRSLRQNKWVKRTPADIYWAGLRSYGIFTGGNLSLSEYIKAICVLKGQKETLSRLGNRNDNAEENESDDRDAGNLFRMRFWNIPTYSKDWMSDMNISLTKDEGSFLKQQIISSFPDSFLAFVLKNQMVEIFSCDSFQDLKKLIHSFPEHIQYDYSLAYQFSEFLYALRVVYNMIVSDDRNEAAEKEWAEQKNSLGYLSGIDLESIFSRLGTHRNYYLCRFLLKEQELMRDGDLEGMRLEIRRRERELKGNRAKTQHPGEFDTSAWFSGRNLDYRFGNAKVIIRDIFESEGYHVKSK